MKILLVEDEPGTRAALSKLLRRAGARVTAAGEGSEALKHLFEQKFDVLLTDLHMPGASMDGFGLLEQVHRLPLDYRPKRTIAISGEYDRGVIQSLLNQSPSIDFFPKPIDLNSLLDTIGGVAH